MGNALARKNAEKTAYVLRALAHPIRVGVCMLLKPGSGGMPVWALAEDLRVEQSLLSHHLLAMCRMGILHRERVGKEAVYSLRNVKALHIIEFGFRHRYIFDEDGGGGGEMLL